MMNNMEHLNSEKETLNLFLQRFKYTLLPVIGQNTEWKWVCKMSAEVNGVEICTAPAFD